MWIRRGMRGTRGRMVPRPLNCDLGVGEDNGDSFLGAPLLVTTTTRSLLGAPNIQNG